MPIRSLNNKKIIWAVDPFEESGLLRKNAIQILNLLKEGLHFDVEPVYILRPPFNDALLTIPSLLDEQYRAAQTLLERIEKIAPTLKILPPKILRAPSPSVSSAVDTLCRLSRNSRANLIIANTSGKHGIERFILGSFAETLLLRSQIPVITVNPHTGRIDQFDHILFPTEFGRRSYPMFKETIKIARKFRSKVTIFHAIPYPVKPEKGSNVVYPRSFRQLMSSYLERERARTLRRTSAWRSWAQSQGVDVDLVIEKRTGSIWKHLIDVSKRRKVRLIAIESQSGPAVSNLIGSTTRQVVRNATCPVWVLRSRYAERVKQPTPQRLRRVA